MDNLLLHILLYSRIREVLLYSLVHPSLFTKQVWRLLCKKLLSCSWSEHKHIAGGPRRRFVEIAYRKGLQPPGLSLYSEEYVVLFAMFNRNLERLREVINRYPGKARSLFFKLNAKKERLFYQREFSVLVQELGFGLDWLTNTVAEAEEKSNLLVGNWKVATRLLINGDEWSLEQLKQLFFLQISTDSNQSLSELVLQDKKRTCDWLCVYSFSRDEHMIQELLKRQVPISRVQMRHLLMNLCTCNNLTLLAKLEKKHGQVLSFEDKLHCLTNYYLYSADDRGLYKSLLQVMKEKQPLTKETSIIFEIELYEVRELLRREGLSA